MQKNDYLIAKFGVDTAENEPLQVWGVIQFNIQFRKIDDDFWLNFRDWSGAKEC